MGKVHNFKTPLFALSPDLIILGIHVVNNIIACFMVKLFIKIVFYKDLKYIFMLEFETER